MTKTIKHFLLKIKTKTKSKMLAKINTDCEMLKQMSDIWQNLSKQRILFCSPSSSYVIKNQHLKGMCVSQFLVSLLTMTLFPWDMMLTWSKAALCIYSLPPSAVYIVQAWGGGVEGEERGQGTQGKQVNWITPSAVIRTVFLWKKHETLGENFKWPRT